MENKKNSDFKSSAKIIGSAIKSSFKTHKLLWGIGIAVLILIIVFTAFLAALRSESVVEKLADVIIPKTVTVDDITFYREPNPEYEASETKTDGENYLSIYNFYYFNSYDEKVDLPSGEYHYLDSEGNSQIIQPGLAFTYQAAVRLSNLSTALNIVKWVLVVGFIVFLIVLWYLKDKKMNEENKPKRLRKADNKNQ